MIESWIPLVLQAGRNASRRIMDIYQTPFEVNYKADDSPVTKADMEADKIIRDTLAPTGIPMITEESFAAFDPKTKAPMYWVVDPIDGTRDFVNRTNEFTVNIALVQHGSPVLGLLIAPALESFPGGAWLGWPGQGLWHWNLHQSWELSQEHRHQTKRPAKSGMLASRSDYRDSGEAMQKHFGAKAQEGPTRRVGSSLKFAWIAAGLAEWYPRAQHLSAWDLAAGHALVLAAGGKVEEWKQGVPLSYDLPQVHMPSFVAYAPGVHP